MGKLITIAGNIGAGKTTLAKLLCEQGSFTPYWEKPEERPFQKAFTHDMRKWALANQMDFFLFRCEQEQRIRKNNQVAVMDGGFDQDFQVFTKNLYNKGHLNPEEFHLCERYYQFVRSFLHPPDIIIRITVDMPVLLQRRANRDRATVDQIFNPQEFVDLEILLDEWLYGEISSLVLLFPFDHHPSQFVQEIETLIRQVNDILDTPP